MSQIFRLIVSNSEMMPIKKKKKKNKKKKTNKQKPKLNIRTVHFWLPFEAQKRRVLKLPIVMAVGEGVRRKGWITKLWHQTS